MNLWFHLKRLFCISSCCNAGETSVLLAKQQSTEPNTPTDPDKLPWDIIERPPSYQTIPLHK